MERILCVFEGERAEKFYFNSLKKAFFPENTVFILATYQNDIYELYQELENDEDLDIIELIKEIKVSKNEVGLSDITREQIGQVYLFFDYECHDDKFEPSKLVQMLELFSDETDKGKLFVSYPMVEAIRDIDDDQEFIRRTVTIEECRNYKQISASRGANIYAQARKLQREHWNFLVYANIKKANYLLSGQAIVQPIEKQSHIASCQIEKYLPDLKVSVLSAFPIFVVDYYGSSQFDGDHTQTP